MSDLQIFENPEFGSIRTVEIGGEPWLVGKDVAAALGYGKGKSLANAIANHVDPEDKGVTELMTPGGKQNVTIINESGVYSLIFSSKLPDAKKFKRWVTSEVLPSIRKTGGYTVPGTPAKTIEDLTAAVQLLTERLDAMTGQQARLPAPPLALTGNEDQQTFGPSARKRWMRTVSEKLDLLSAKLNHPNSVILSQIYRIMEEKWNVNLEEERLRTAESLNLYSCSVLAAISHSEKLREAFQSVVDFNLAPENRGW